MKHEVLIGQTDYTVLVKIRTDAGAPATGLDEGDIDIAYARVETDNDVTTADVTPAALTALTDAHADWGFEEVSATDHPGLYRLDIADAVFASGAWSAVVTITGTGLDPADLEFVLVSHNPQTALAAVLADSNELQTDWADGGRLDLILDARASQASVDDLPTNAELATSQAAADDATLAAISAVDAKIDIIDTNVDQIETLLGETDTDVAAIKAKTDSLTFTEAGVVDANANVTHINDVEVTGDGALTPWGPA
jgi:hypothetical protein